MKNILIISKREITRLRTRFSGRSRLIVLAVLFLALLSSYIIYHQDLVISKGLYTVGVSSGAPPITDKRFNVVELDPEAGHTVLYKGTIDVYVNGNDVICRGDHRSQYAAGALQQYLEKQELARIANEYEIDKAFPLRVEIRYLEAPEGDSDSETRASLSDILELTEPLAMPPDTSEPAPVPAVSGISEPASEPAVSGISKAALAPEPAAPGASVPTGVSSTDIPVPTPQPVASTTDAAVRQQLDELGSGNKLPEFRAEFISEKDIIIPSLMNPPIPLAQVIIAFFYVVPMFFVSLFFTSSFTEEKVNRKLVILLSAPVTPFQVILGKMLPYLGYSIIGIIAITLLLGGNISLALAIFTPIMLFIFSIYLMVALMYRTFKDQTFFSVLALSVITIYLVAPAMFTGVSDLSYISPLTLAVEMYRGTSFGLAEYFLATTPLYLVFLQTMFIGTRVFNEEYLMGFRPLHTKVAEALYLVMDKNHLNVSVLLVSLFLVPIVFMVQLASLVIVSNLPMPFALGFLLVISVIVEEIAKSTGIVVLLQNKIIKSWKDVVILASLSALGFLLGEKLLLYLALSVLSESAFITAIFGAGLLVVPLILHVVSTSVVCLMTARFGIKYFPLAIVAGSVIHALYNLYVIGVVL